MGKFEDREIAKTTLANIIDVKNLEEKKDKLLEFIDNYEPNGYVDEEDITQAKELLTDTKKLIIIRDAVIRKQNKLQARREIQGLEENSDEEEEEELQFALQM